MCIYYPVCPSSSSLSLSLNSSPSLLNKTKDLRGFVYGADASRRPRGLKLKVFWWPEKQSPSGRMALGLCAVYNNLNPISTRYSFPPPVNQPSFILSSSASSLSRGSCLSLVEYLILPGACPPRPPCWPCPSPPFNSPLLLS